MTHDEAMILVTTLEYLIDLHLSVREGHMQFEVTRRDVSEALVELLRPVVTEFCLRPHVTEAEVIE